MKFIKAIVLIGLIVPGAWILLRGPKAGADIPAGRIVVDYWEKWTADEGAQMRLIVKDFNETVGADQGIYVRYVSTSTINQKALVATAAGVPPDVAGMWDHNLVQFAELGAIEPLDDLAAEYGITAATYKPVYWNACHYNGHLYALISTPAVTVLHYNTTAFGEKASKLREAGLDPTRPPATIAELDRYAEALDEIDPSGRIIKAGYLPMEPGWYVNQTYIWFGGNIWDEVHHQFTLTDPKVVAAFAWVQSYSKRLGSQAMTDFRGGFSNFDSPQNPFLAGTVLMEQQGPWMANYILNLKPSMDGLKRSSEDDFNAPLAERQARMHWAAAPFPSAVPGLNDVAYVSFDTLTIPRGARHKKEAFKFIAYLQRQDVMEKLCKMHSKNSPLANVSQDFIEHHKNPYIKVFEDLSRSPNARAGPKIPIMPEVNDEMTNMVQRLVLLRTDPKTALEETQDILQKKYDHFMEIQRARRDENHKVEKE